MVHLMEWFAERDSSLMVLVIHADILHLKVTSPVTEMMGNISLMKPEGPFQINCITGKIIDDINIDLNFYIINY